MNTHPLICLYFQVHQPYRLRDLRITDIGQGTMEYFDDDKNQSIFRKVAEKCYLPANALMLELLQTYPDFAIAYSLSGSFLDQCEEYGPDVLESFRALARTGKVEFLAETYNHSLSSIKSLEEFCIQTSQHVKKIQTLFGQTPRIFRNTELIYNNELAHVAKLMGFHGMLAEGADHILHGRSPNTPFTTPEFRLPAEKELLITRMFPSETIRLQRGRHGEAPGGGLSAEQKTNGEANLMKVLLKNYKLSDDVAFRFSDRSWLGYPLHADTFTDWLMGSKGHSVNLFMDYETFGEHQWADTGIFEFLRALPKLWQERGIRAVTPSTVLAEWNDRPCDIFDAHNVVSWADIERDLSAWQGNRIQEAALSAVFALEAAVKLTNDPELLKTWRRLTTSDHFYYMSTKYWSDGDVHKYFSPYESPYEAYRRFSHAICDLKVRLSLPS